MPIPAIWTAKSLRRIISRIQIGNKMAPTTFKLNPLPEPSNSPNNTSRDYQNMSPFWTLVDDILAGADAIRDKGETYLPRFAEETKVGNNDPYALRLRNAPFTNLYEDISRNLGSKPFSEECKLIEKSNQVYQDLATNIDGQGNNLHVFAQTVFQSGVDYALAWILVDHTRATPRKDGGVLSVTEEKEQGLRPYWVLVPSTRLLAVYSEFIGGREILTHARIYEPSTILNGYLEVNVERVRVLRRDPTAFDLAGKPIAYGPPYFELWESMPQDPNSKQATWVMVDGGPLAPLTEIPLVPFITGVRDPASWRVRPPLRGIANMQIQEYNQESNLKSVMELTCFPVLSGTGITPPDNNVKIPIGPRAVLYGGSSADGQPGSWAYIEPGAASITALQNQLKNIQNDMRDLGMQPLTMQNLTVITTGQVAVKANSAVKAWTIKFKDALEQAWMCTAQWLGRPDAPEVFVFDDFNVVLDDGKGWAAVWLLRTGKEISHETTIQSALRYGYLPDSFDIEKNDEELAAEADNASPGGEQMIDPRTGKVIPMAGQAPPVGATSGGARKLPPVKNQRTI